MTYRDLIDTLYNGNDYEQEQAIGNLWALFRETNLHDPDIATAIIHAVRENRDNNPLVIMDGLGLLSDLADPTSFDAMVEMLSEPLEEFREGAAEVLGALKDARAVQYLIPLLKDEFPEVQWAAAVALRFINNQQGLDAVSEWERNQ